MNHRRPRRWQTTFGRFVSDVGVSRLREALNERGIEVTSQAVYHWISGVHRPSAVKRRALVEISGGRLREVDVQRHRREVPRKDVDGTM